MKSEPVGLPAAAVVTVADLVAYASGLGFVACGVASLEPSRYGDRLDRWLRAGYAGTMRYLHRQARKRKAPASIVAGARVAVVVLDNYWSREAGSGKREEGVRIAKYARGTDYHVVLRKRLGLLADWLRERGAAVAHAWADSGPVPERELAVRAGLGWIGKNGMLIHPRLGSYCFIGTVFTDLALEAAPHGEPDHCGRCTRCLEACPTQAFIEPRLLDATKCISYLTIESRLPVPESRIEQLNGWAFGCDICNDVCPWNLRFAEPTGVAAYRDRGAVARDDPGCFERMSEAEFAERFADTPLERAGLAGMRRNWAAAFQSLADRGSPP